METHVRRGHRQKRNGQCLEISRPFLVAAMEQKILQKQRRNGYALR